VARPRPGGIKPVCRCVERAAAVQCAPSPEACLTPPRPLPPPARPPQHYAVLFDAGEVAKLLMRRSGSGGELQRARDSCGLTPFDLAMAKGRVADEDLFLLLSSQ
jgi:hypothetical protein